MPRFDLSEYEPVEVRLAAFWDQHPGGRVTTELVLAEGGQFIVKAFLFRDDGIVPFATGYAEEIVGSTNVNKTSALENGETSAIGRALANANYAAKGKRPSREEMDKVNRYDEEPPGSETRPQRFARVTPAGGETRLASEKQRYMLKAKLKKAGFSSGYPKEWMDAGLPEVNDLFPFDDVNRGLEVIDQLEPVNA